MKCTRCKGKGKFIGYYVNDNPVECECVICKGAGEVQMTEQEYIQTCNTEQLAEWLAKQKCDGCNDEPYDEHEQHEPNEYYEYESKYVNESNKSNKSNEYECYAGNDE